MLPCRCFLGRVRWRMAQPGRPSCFRAQGNRHLARRICRRVLPSILPSIDCRVWDCPGPGQWMNQRRLSVMAGEQHATGRLSSRLACRSLGPRHVFLRHQCQHEHSTAPPGTRHVRSGPRPLWRRGMAARTHCFDKATTRFQEPLNSVPPAPESQHLTDHVSFGLKRRPHFRLASSTRW